MDTRRDFLKKAIGAGIIVAAVPSICTVCGSEAFASSSPGLNGNIIVDLAKFQFKKLQTQFGSVQYTLPSPNSGITLLITRKDTEVFTVLNAKCTHKGSLVNPYEPALNLFNCSSTHGSQYNIDGVVVHDPSTINLTSYHWTFDSTTNILTILGDSLGVNNLGSASLELEQNSPNPFSSQTTITFTIPEAAHISLRISDEVGKEIATVYEGTLEAGKHSMVFNASNLPHGVYFYRLSTPSGSLIKQMVVSK